MQSTCFYSQCPNPVKTDGLCNGHAHQRRRGIELRPLRTTATRGATLQERLDLRTDKSGGPDACWPWIGSKGHQGHGRMRDPRKGYAVLTHRLVYELAYGPIPDGAIVDHKCRTPSCQNPAHMHLVTQKLNGENRAGANKNNRSSGVRNVSWIQGAWNVLVHDSGKTHYGGRFQSLIAAELAAIALRKKVFKNILEDDVPTVTVDVLASEFKPSVEKAPCSLEGCDRPLHSKGLCKRHYTRQHEGKPMEPPRRVPKVCSESGCVKPAKSRGMCGMHYERWRKQRPAA